MYNKVITGVGVYKRAQKPTIYVNVKVEYMGIAFFFLYKSLKKKKNE